MLGEELLGKAGPVKTADVLAGKKYVMIYFSAHWCPPCRGFTPHLAEIYKSGAEEQGIEVIFASSDRDEASFNGYYGEMPWLAVPFADRAKKDSLSKKFGVKGIPMLVVLDGDGKLVTTDGRAKAGEFFSGGYVEGEAAAPMKGGCTVS